MTAASWSRAHPIGNGASRLAQGGIAAAIGADDTPDLHAADTIAVSAGLAAADIAALVTAAAPARIDWLRGMGVEFDCDASGKPALGREAGHRRHRIVHAGGDRTGAAIMQALGAAARRRPDIRALEGFNLVDVITAGARAAGVLLEGEDGTRLAVLAPHVVLATGGIGACFERTTNPAGSQGAGLAAAARAGVRLADLEFMQFHPTALAVAGDPQPLLTEALRGAGALLLDERGRRFMPAIHPDAELAPRDVIARSVAARALAGRPVYLDATGITGLAERFPGACAIAAAAGFDPARQPLPVAAAAHFHMGGIATDAVRRDLAARPLGLRRSGVDRPAWRQPARQQLAARRAGLRRAHRARVARGALAEPPRRRALEVPRRTQLPANEPARVQAIRRLVGESLGPLRHGTAMTAALARLTDWRCASRAEEDISMVARLMLSAALGRRESRGAHYRSDYPLAADGTPSRSFAKPAAAPVEVLTPARSRVA